MKGRISMNQEIIKVTLSQQGDSDFLTFHIKEDDATPEYIVDLSDSAKSQTQLKRVFSRLLTLLVEKDICLVLDIEAGFTRALQKDVSEEYIKDLNSELANVKELMNEQLASENSEDQTV